LYLSILNNVDMSYISSFNSRQLAEAIFDI